MCCLLRKLKLRVDKKNELDNYEGMSFLELTIPPMEPLPEDEHALNASPPEKDALTYYELMLLQGEKIFKVPVKEIIILYD